MDVRRRTSGFTLVEILIVITIIGVLASIAYPSYQQYVVKANRAAAQQFLLEAASVQHQYFLANNGNGYATQSTLIGASGLLSTPSNVSSYYDITSPLQRKQPLLLLPSLQRRLLVVYSRLMALYQ